MWRSAGRSGSTRCGSASGRAGRRCPEVVRRLFLVAEARRVALAVGHRRAGRRSRRRRRRGSAVGSVIRVMRPWASRAKAIPSVEPATWGCDDVIPAASSSARCPPGRSCSSGRPCCRPRTPGRPGPCSGRGRVEQAVAGAEELHRARPAAHHLHVGRAHELQACRASTRRARSSRARVDRDERLARRQRRWRCRTEAHLELLDPAVREGQRHQGGAVGCRQ